MVNHSKCRTLASLERTKGSAISRGANWFCCDRQADVWKVTAASSISKLKHRPPVQSDGTTSNLMWTYPSLYTVRFSWYGLLMDGIDIFRPEDAGRWYSVSLNLRILAKKDYLNIIQVGGKACEWEYAHWDKGVLPNVVNLRAAKDKADSCEMLHVSVVPKY